MMCIMKKLQREITATEGSDQNGNCGAKRKFEEKAFPILPCAAGMPFLILHTYGGLDRGKSPGGLEPWGFQVYLYQ